jgi:hypothetical protein
MDVLMTVPEFLFLPFLPYLSETPVSKRVKDKNNHGVGMAMKMREKFQYWLPVICWAYGNKSKLGNRARVW